MYVFDIFADRFSFVVAVTVLLSIVILSTTLYWLTEAKINRIQSQIQALNMSKNSLKEIIDLFAERNKVYNENLTKMRKNVADLTSSIGSVKNSSAEQDELIESNRKVGEYLGRMIENHGHMIENHGHMIESQGGFSLELADQIRTHTKIFRHILGEKSGVLKTMDSNDDDDKVH